MSQSGKELRFGVIGCGHMAQTVHCPNMEAIPGAKTVAYCDLAEERAAGLLKKHGGDYTTTDPDRIINDPSLDGVLIQTGPHMHPKLVRAAARAGKHIFVEKPISLTLADAWETVRIVEESGVKFVYGTCNRLAPMVKIAKRMCPNPVASYCQCTDTVTHQACHNLDLAVNLFHEAPLERIYASGSQVWKNLDPGIAADCFSAVLTFADASTHTYIQHGRAYNPLLKKYHFQLFGKDGCVYLAKRFKECHWMTAPDKVERSWLFEGQDFDRGPFGYMGHYDEVKELVDCIRAGHGNGTVTVRDAARTMAVETAILQSITTGQVIDFPAFLKANGMPMR